MGKMELESRKRRRSKDIQRAILGVIATAGVLAVAACAPNALQVLSSLGFSPRKKDTDIIRHARGRLIKGGLLKMQDGQLILTNKGTQKLNLLEEGEYNIKKPRRWDKRWRVLIFDISEKRRKVRDKIRQTLVSIGFIKLQHSVWVYPYDCENLIALLKTDFKVGRELLYLIVDSIENDSDLRKQFGLALD